MGIYQYTALAFVSASSIAVGAFLASQCEEELKAGSKYIKTLMAVTTYIVMLLVARELTSNILLSSFIPTILIFLTFYISKNFRSYIFLVYLAVCFFAVNNNSFNYIVPSLIFITGLCIGSILYYSERKRIYASLSINTFIFLFTALILLIF
jgi:hypothetical protein